MSFSEQLQDMNLAQPGRVKIGDIILYDCSNTSGIFESLLELLFLVFYCGACEFKSVGVRPPVYMSRLSCSHMQIWLKFGWLDKLIKHLKKRRAKPPKHERTSRANRQLPASNIMQDQPTE